MKVVLDTNILVSGLWSANTQLASILEMVIKNILTPCYNSEIMKEYREVLARPHLAFRFKEARVDEILKKIVSDGMSVVVAPSKINFVDNDDRCFYDVAVVCDAILITGNLKHYPKKSFIMSPSQFLKFYSEKFPWQES